MARGRKLALVVATIGIFLGSAGSSHAALLGLSLSLTPPGTVLPACAAWTVVAAAHLAFHVTHLDGLSTADQILQTSGLAAALAPAVVAVRLR